MVRGGNSANGRSLAYVVMVGLFLRNSPASAALAAHRFAYPRSRTVLRIFQLRVPVPSQQAWGPGFVGKHQGPSSSMTHHHHNAWSW